MFKILDERQLSAKTRLRRWQALALFCGGIVFGGLINSTGGWPPEAHAQVAPTPQIQFDGCGENPPAQGLKLDCSLSLSR